MLRCIRRCSDIWKGGHSHGQTSSDAHSQSFSVTFWGYFLFWTWNLIFLLFMFLGFAPYMLPQSIGAVRTGSIPVAFLSMPSS